MIGIRNKICGMRLLCKMQLRYFQFCKNSKNDAEKYRGIAGRRISKWCFWKPWRGHPPAWLSSNKRAYNVWRVAKATHVVTRHLRFYKDSHHNTCIPPANPPWTPLPRYSTVRIAWKNKESRRGVSAWCGVSDR